MIFDREEKAADFYRDGLSELRRGEFTEATKLLTVAVFLRPQFAGAHAALCLAAHEARDHHRLFNALMELLDLPDEAAVLRGLAVSSYEAGMYEEAIISIQESINIRPQDALSHYILGRSHLAIHEFNEATESFHKALELSPDFAIVESLLRWISNHLSVAEDERVRLLINAPRVPMHQPPPDTREMEKLHLTPDSIQILYG